MKKDTWRQIIQMIITVLTAISGSFLMQSCGLLH
ncbi:MAG: smalltalk protein [Prevotella sp.]|nr:smalltalk protein [Prevotella sp.]MBQ5494176.1 smalltalk protein [Prevotella sp.]MBQ5549046.1 smalltalk protein [Prevotella sp.]